MCLLWLDPHILFSVKNSQARVIFLAIIATEDPEFTVIERRCMVLDLRCNDGAEHSLR